MNSGEMRDEAAMPEEMEDVRAPETVEEMDMQAGTEMSAGKEVPETETVGTETGEENDSEDPEKSQEEPEKKGFFSKKKDKKDPRDAQIEELTDRVRRIMVEFDDYRKWAKEEKLTVYEIGAKDIVERMLPVTDNFGRGLAVIPEDAKGSSFAEGIEMTYRRLLKVLEETGVRPIEAVGQESDPNFHSAVMHIEDENLGENIVAQEPQRGHVHRDSVMRHSMIRVANQLEAGNWKLTNIRK